ncbi:FtsX-like permease family protein [Streptomyces sp. ADI93-02]|uniref:FtsX-like permease family protein n=1 Tax=Streptomyces sp. ADI93-02 TaxID=1522757 RepID=UPI000F555CD6|nr:FtsX-like permease family protein [Streptomyces sp. ADI93-02]RPK32976.1 FtsX-like permease family protein [Streptomyces sp. ADI93-02]
MRTRALTALARGPQVSGGMIAGLTAAPGLWLAYGALVVLTSFLAAALPLAIQVNEDRALRQTVSASHPSRSTLQLNDPQTGLGLPLPERETALGEAAVEKTYHRVLENIPDLLKIDESQTSYGIRTSNTLAGLGPEVPRPDGLPPQFSVAAQAGLAEHATVREGHFPRAPGRATAVSAEIEAAITTDTAKEMGLRLGSVIPFVPMPQGHTLRVRITGILEPRSPEASYWSAQEILWNPSLDIDQSRPPREYWKAGLLIHPAAAPALLGTLGEPEAYWYLAPAPGAFTPQNLPALTDQIASLEGGPGLVGLRGVAGEDAVLATGLDAMLSSHEAVASTLNAIVTVAAVSTGSVAAITLVIAAGILARRRDSEFALLRARGASLSTLGSRLLIESVVVVVPAAAAGLLVAVRLIGESEAAIARAVTASGGVALLACTTLPVLVVTAHGRVRVHDERGDLAGAKHSGRRTVVELTLLAFAVSAVATLRRSGTAGDSNLLAASAPVLTSIVAAFLLTRSYPLPLRRLGRLAARRRGLLGFLSLARVGRAGSSGTLPIMVLLIALTTASFGGAVLAAVAGARDQAALRTLGADARISAPVENPVLPDSITRTVRAVPGVRVVAPVMVEEEVNVLLKKPAGGRRFPALIAVDPKSFSQFLRAVGSTGFPVGSLKSDANPDRPGVISAIASPGVAETLGHELQQVSTRAGIFTLRVTAIQTDTPVISSSEFLIVDSAQLPEPATTTLLISGEEADGPALRKAVSAYGNAIEVRLRTEERERYADSPLQSGAELIFASSLTAGSVFALTALSLSFLAASKERTSLLARLRTMGLTRRQARWLLVLEALPPAALAAVGGVLVGGATIWALGPGLDLSHIAFSALPGSGPTELVSLAVDARSLCLPALAVVALSVATATVQAWWAARAGTITELRAGDAR